MKFQIVTLFPEMIQAALGGGVVSQGLRKGLLEVSTIQPRDFAEDAHRSVDDRPFGGGDGMIMMPEILAKCVGRARSQAPTKVIYLTPQGPRLDDAKVRELATAGTSLTLVCGRYGGIDQRALSAHVDEELSIGDYVLSGGELAALVVIDSVARQLPGVLGHADSAEQDSFANGLLEHPNFTRPREWNGGTVPEVLLSGNHARILLWKQRMSELVSLKKRPELLGHFSDRQWRELETFWLSLSAEDRSVCGFSDFKFQRVRDQRSKKAPADSVNRS